MPSYMTTVKVGTWKISGEGGWSPQPLVPLCKLSRWSQITHEVFILIEAEQRGVLLQVSVLLQLGFQLLSPQLVRRAPFALLPSKRGVHFWSLFYSFHFIFLIISFQFVSFHSILFHLNLFHFISFHFISFHFISFHFISFHFTVISFHSIPFYFHFVSFHFISFQFIPSHSIYFHVISIFDKRR